MLYLKAILRDVEGHVKEWAGATPLHSDGRADSRWVVLDYVDVMVHIMHRRCAIYTGWRISGVTPRSWSGATQAPAKRRNRR